LSSYPFWTVLSIVKESLKFALSYSLLAFVFKFYSFGYNLIHSTQKQHVARDVCQRLFKIKNSNRRSFILLIFSC